MASKRDLKKAIKRACGSIAGECLMAEYNIENAETEKWDNVIINIALLQEEAIKKMPAPFGKKTAEFENKKLYRKARRAHNKQAVKELTDYMHGQVENVVKEMNALLPSKA